MPDAEQQSLEQQQERLEEKLQAVQVKVAELPDVTPDLKATAASLAAERLRAGTMQRHAEEQRAAINAAREAQKALAQGVEEATRLMGGGVAAALGATAEEERRVLVGKLEKELVEAKALLMKKLEIMHQVLYRLLYAPIIMYTTVAGPGPSRPGCRGRTPPPGARAAAQRRGGPSVTGGPGVGRGRAGPGAGCGGGGGACQGGGVAEGGAPASQAGGRMYGTTILTHHCTIGGAPSRA